MPYATVDDMIARFGEAEMVRVSTPDGADMVAVVPAPIWSALDRASAMIDTYLRKGYRVPLDVAPQEIKDACGVLARYDLSSGGQRTPTETMTTERASTIKWLLGISRGDVLLDLQQVDIGDESYAQTASRQSCIGNGYGGCGGWGDNGGGFP